MIKHTAMSFFILIIFTGCITPPRQFTDTELTKETIMVEKQYKVVYANLITGFRSCGKESKGIIFAHQIGVPECHPDIEGANYLCDVYMGSPYGGRWDHVLGIIKISGTDNSSTSVEFRRPTRYERTTDYSIIYWKNFINGDYSCELKDK